MPSIGQIIPEYLNPHVMTVINDNTIIEDEVSVGETPVRALQVFTSPKGRDNVIIPFESVSEYLKEYGNPNINLYGQPGYMPYAYLGSNNARVYCMRVMPDDAAFSNVVIVAKVKVDDTVPASPKLIIKHQAQFFNDVNTQDDFIPSLEALVDEDPDVDGYATYPLLLIHSAGRGVYGDNLRIRISSHTQADKDNQYKNHRVEIFTTENGFEKLELFEGAFFMDAVRGLVKESYYIEDILNDNSSKVKAMVYYSSFEKIFDMYKADVDPDTTYTLETFDVITGVNKLTTIPEPKIQIDYISGDAVSLARVEGVTLSGGSDGVIAPTNPDGAARVAAMDALYISAFAGNIDKAILSKRRVPCEIIMDANYSDLVKKSLITLFLKRYDAFGFIDGGILSDTTAAIDWAEYMKDFGDRVFSKECQHFKMRDPFSGKIISLTTTYFLATKLPTHFQDIGNQVAFVGKDLAQLSGIVRNSLQPVIDADDLDIKEQLYLRRVNYFHTIAEGVYVRATQTTSQFSSSDTLWSDLSEENNMHVLLQMKRMVETYVSETHYKFADAEDRARFTSNVKDMFAPFIGSKVFELNVKFAMNTWESERSILHCYLDVKFRKMAKRGIIEIDINKNV